jgi:dienelactone hydrolase
VRGLSFFLGVVVLLVSATCGPAIALPSQRVVDLTASDGIKLKATYFAAGKPGPGVLLLHQCNRQRKVWDSVAQELAAAGIHVLTLDYRGFGESEGERFATLAPDAARAQVAKRPGDIDIAFNYLTAQPGVAHDWIGVGGASCGVNNSIQTARRHPNVKSLVLLSGGTDLDGRQFLRNSATLPVFFSVADDDEFQPTIVSIEWLYSLTPSPEKRFKHYATGGHGADMFPVHPELPRLIVDWYVATLLKTPGHAPATTDTPTIPEEVRVLDVLDQPGGAAKVRAMVQQSREKNSQSTLFSEPVVNFMGYEHLQSSDTKGAVEIFNLNVDAYPNSPNAYDSLSDALLADGQKELARKNARRALELLAADKTDAEERRKAIRDSAEEKLKQLGDAPQ